ncbi:MAG: hypothetical protein C4547_03415 [Phycisphaerales bacterium]|nr:MAG: hypothetical protein C4547_03415 [Phycisphaerales bacterium]
MKTRDRIAILIVLAVNLALWVIPSDVVELVARERVVLLGRYSRTHFGWIIGVLLISPPVLFLATAPDARRKRRRAMILMAGGLAALGVTCASDLAKRSAAEVYYIKDKLAYHRPANVSYPVADVVDRPESAFTYPDAPPGYPAFQGKLSTDARGYRNPEALQRAEVLVIGDSYAEGSNVSDEHAWPRRLGERCGTSLYNTGMSGYAPHNYLAVLREFGPSLDPRVVICLFYEENDFRTAEVRDTPEPEGRRFFKQSPILQALDRTIVGSLGDVGSSRGVSGMDVLSWMPVRVPGGDGPAYAFSPNLLLDLYKTTEELAESGQWEAIRENFTRMRGLCVERQDRFIIAYAPSKPHVVLPLAVDRIPADKLHAFARLREDDLPPPEEFRADLMGSLDNKERLLSEWCAREKIEFVSLTEPLREALAGGRQVYFTYDDHWSPDGHDVVAEVLSRYGACDAP